MTSLDVATIALTNLRDQYDAFSAMRNDLNEILGDMISQEATLKDSPEMVAECAAVVDAVARFKTRQAERIAELERALATIESGTIPGIGLMILGGKWRDVVIEMQSIARAALTKAPSP